MSEEARRSFLLRALADAWVYPPPRQLRSFPVPRGPARGRTAGAMEDEVVLLAKKMDKMVPKKNAGTWVRSLVREDPTCRGAAGPVRRGGWACALEPGSHGCWAHVPQVLRPACLEPVLCNERGHRGEGPARCSGEWPPLAAAGGSPHAATRTQRSQK